MTTKDPVAWMDMVTVNLVREGINKHKARELANHFYTHPAHDDTALLRMALEALKQIDYDSTEDGTLNQVIAALRERLGEKV